MKCASSEIGLFDSNLSTRFLPHSILLLSTRYILSKVGAAVPALLFYVPRAAQTYIQGVPFELNNTPTAHPDDIAQPHRSHSKDGRAIGQSPPSDSYRKSHTTHRHQSPSTHHKAHTTYHSSLTTRRPPPTIHLLPSTVHRPPSTIHLPPSTFYHPTSTIHHPPSTTHHPTPTIHYPPSTPTARVKVNKCL
jgi:hypothetical protein